MNLSGILGLFLLLAAPAASDDKVNIPPPAPLPEVVTHAKVVMLTSEIGSGLAYDEAYKCLREWGRFQLTGNPDMADLTFVLRSDLSGRPPHLRDIFFPYPYPPPFYDQYLYLVIVDPKTNQEVWSERQFQRSALKEKNRQKEIILAVDALFKHLRERIPGK